MESIGDLLWRFELVYLHILVPFWCHLVQFWLLFQYFKATFSGAKTAEKFFKLAQGNRKVVYKRFNEDMIYVYNKGHGRGRIEVGRGGGP